LAWGESPEAARPIPPARRLIMRQIAAEITASSPSLSPGLAAASSCQSVREGAAGMLAIAGDFYGIAGIVTVGATVLFVFFDCAPTRWMRAESFPFVGHDYLQRDIKQFCFQVDPRLSDKLFVTDFVENARRIFETATCAEGAELESGELSILIGADGAIRMLMGSDWPLDSLESHYGARAAYRVSRHDNQVRVEGKSRNASCLLRSESVSSVARRLLADRPRYMLAA